MIAFDELTTGAVATARRQTMADLLRRSAARHPGRTAIVDGDVRVTYAELDEAVNRAANALAERGLAKGDRLALLGHNSLGFVITYFACARLGLICVPINYMLGAEEIAYILDHAGATAMVAEDMLLPLAEAGIAAAGRERAGDRARRDRRRARARLGARLQLGDAPRRGRAGRRAEPTTTRSSCCTRAAPSRARRARSSRAAASSRSTSAASSTAR